MSLFEDGRVRFVCTLVSICGLGLAQASCTTADGKEWAPQPMPAADEEPAEAVGEAPSALTGTHKMCSGFVSGNYRDTILVPSAWSSGMCQSWVASTGTSSWQIGCVFDWGYSWGTPNGGLPPSNCGW